MQYEDRITIATPEGVDLELALAGIGSRFVAAVIDTAVLGALITALGAAVSAIAGATRRGPAFERGGVPDASAGALALAVFFVLSFVILFGYHVLFETLASGRSPGKRAAGLRVLGSGGEPITFSASAIRNLIRSVDFLPGAYLVGLVAILVTNRNQRLGDLAAGTIVVRERSGGRSGRTPVSWPLPGAFPLPDGYEQWDVSMVSAEELSTVRRYLDRRASLTVEARARLAWQLAQRLRPSVAGAPDDLNPEAFLEAVAAAKARRS